jgi:hypothetical protein
MIKSITSFLICFLICLITYGQQTEHEVIITDSLRFSGEIRSRKIIVGIGEFFEFPASCAKDPTTFIQSSKFIFPDASLGKIDTCSMIYELQSDTIRKVIISLPNTLSVQQGGKQATKQFGKPTYSKEGSKYVYAWKYTTKENRKLSIRLEVAADQKHGMIYITEQV